MVDGFRQKIGIRSVEFKGKDGFFLNGKPYDKPLLGGNRHQDFAIVGNALSNNINWRDAYKLKRLVSMCFVFAIIRKILPLWMLVMN